MVFQSNSWWSGQAGVPDAVLEMFLILSPRIGHLVSGKAKSLGPESPSFSWYERCTAPAFFLELRRVIPSFKESFWLSNSQIQSSMYCLEDCSIVRLEESIASGLVIETLGPSIHVSNVSMFDFLKDLDLSKATCAVQTFPWQQT